MLFKDLKKLLNWWEAFEKIDESFEKKFKKSLYKILGLFVTYATDLEAWNILEIPSEAAWFLSKKYK